MHAGPPQHRVFPRPSRGSAEGRGTVPRRNRDRRGMRRSAGGRGQGRSAKPTPTDRKSVVSGKSVSVRVDLGGRRIIKKKKHNKHIKHTNYKHKTKSNPPQN